MALDSYKVLCSSSTKNFGSVTYKILCMETLADRIQRLRKERGWDQSELARRVSALRGKRVPPQSIQQLEEGTIGRPRYLPELAKTLGTSIEYLLSGSGLQNLAAGPAVKGVVPLISWVQAGAWCEIVDIYQPGDYEKQVFTTKDVGPRAFALRVSGDSMENPAGRPTYPDGSIIIVDPDRQPINGSRVVVRIDAEETATFKQLVLDGGRKYLKPLNPRYPILDVTKDATICGVVVQTIIDED